MSLRFIHTLRIRNTILFLLLTHSPISQSQRFNGLGGQGGKSKSYPNSLSGNVIGLILTRLIMDLGQPVPRNGSPARI
ncbi:hypothetical protein GGR54DRAFT_595098 [Hypoxylon sp. NC1633]|nr:hypothetical protein GGR54DRAFT_595098 [Hypoxylon sp. NC1633]